MTFARALSQVFSQCAMPCTRWLAPVKFNLQPNISIANAVEINTLASPHSSLLLWQSGEQGHRLEVKKKIGFYNRSRFRQSSLSILLHLISDLTQWK